MKRSLWLLLAFSCGGAQSSPPCDTAVVGNICTLAGNGDNGYSGDDGLALQASFSLPQDTLTSSDGTIYVLDWNNHRIRRLTADGKVSLVAGRGELGGTLDDPANSDFNHPTGMLFSPSGARLLIAAWHNSKLREVDLDTGVITDTCGDGRRAYFGDEGPAITAALDLPASLAWAPSGDLIVMDQANQVMRRIDAAGRIHRYAGRCVVESATAACGAGVSPVACPGGSGKTTCGVPAATCASPCSPGYGGEEGPAMDLRMSQPFGQSADPAGRIAFDKAGNLFFADTANALIRKIGTDGIVRRVAGRAPVNGVAQRGYEGEGGPALDAKLNNPVDLAIDDDGTLYFTDVYNHCVRAIGADGAIRTVVGVCGQPGYTGDRGPASGAKLKRPYGLELVGGVLLISDTGNNVIRHVRLR
jgi:hypothetical protein